MKWLRLLLLCFLFMHPSLMFGQTPVVNWIRSLGGSGGDYAHTVWPTTDGGYVVAGYVGRGGGDVIGYHGNPEIQDLWVVKLDAAGAIQWQKCLGNNNFETGADIRQTADGGYIVAGSAVFLDYEGRSTNYSLDYWVVKLDANGNIQWQKLYGGDKHEYAYGIDIAADGGYVVAGHSESNSGDVTGNHGNRDFWIIKLDESGNLLWQKSLGGSRDEAAYAVKATPDGGCIAVGFTESNDGDVTGNHGWEDVWVVKLDKTGTLQWQKSLGGRQREEAWSVQLTANGGYIVAGYTSSNDGDVSGNHHAIGAMEDYWVVKLTSQGAIEWQNCYGGDLGDVARYIQNTPDGGYVVIGESSSSNGDVSCNAGITDMWVIKISESGKPQWQKSIGGSLYEHAMCVQPLADGGFIAAGTTCSSDIAGYHPHAIPPGTCGDFLVVKLSAPVTAPPPPSLTISPTKVCAGVPATFTAFAQNVGTNASYQWFRNGVAVGSNSASLILSDVAENDKLECKVTSGGGCDNTVAQVSATAVVRINQNILQPTVSITPSLPAVCGCTPVSFQAKVSNGGSAPVFQWLLNDVYTDATYSSYQHPAIKAGDKISCIYTDAAGCVPGGALTATVQIGAAGGQSPGVQIKSSTDIICPGMPVRFTADAVNAGTAPSFQWNVNGASTGTNSASFTSSSLVNGDVVSCVVTADPQYTCASVTTATSNSIKITVSKIEPSVSIKASAETICAGSAVTFTATPVNAGVTPSYQWKRNGTNVGTNNAIFTSPALADGDLVYCVLVADPALTCVSKTTDTSGGIIMAVEKPLRPSVSISANTNNVCQGTEIRFAAVAGNAGTSPSYQWLLNGSAIGNSNVPVFSSRTLQTGDRLSCQVTPTAKICPVVPALSNEIVALINDLPVIHLSPSDTIIQAGNRIRFTAQVTGPVAAYEWQPAAKLEIPFSLSPSTHPLQEQTTFSLTVETDKGCKAVSTAIVKVVKQLYMPNAFTPNGDGLNDVFRIPPGVQLKLKTFSVFDRWGNCVFATKDLSKGWNGKINGTPATSGTYVYLIEGTDDKGAVLVKGTVTLVQ